MYKFLIIVLVSITISAERIDTLYESLGRQRVYITSTSANSGHFYSINGTALSSYDYKTKSKYRNARRDSLRIVLRIYDDTIVEHDEFFYIIFNNIDTTKIIIKDNDIMTDTMIISENSFINYIP